MQEELAGECSNQIVSEDQSIESENRKQMTANGFNKNPKVKKLGKEVGVHRTPKGNVEISVAECKRVRKDVNMREEWRDAQSVTGNHESTNEIQCS